MKVESIENGVVITVDKKENYTLEDLKQKVINDLYKREDYSLDGNEIKLLEVILRYEKSDDIDKNIDKLTDSINTKAFGSKLGSIGTITTDSIQFQIKED